MTAVVYLVDTPLSELKAAVMRDVFALLQRGEAVTIHLDAARPSRSALLGCTINMSKASLRWAPAGLASSSLLVMNQNIAAVDPGRGWSIIVSQKAEGQATNCLWLNLDGGLPAVFDSGAVAKCAECDGFGVVVSVSPIPAEQLNNPFSMVRAALAGLNRLEHEVMKGKPMAVCLSAPPDVAYTIGMFMAGFGRFPFTKYLHKDAATGQLVMGGQRP